MRIAYYNFGKDTKYLTDVKIKIIDCKINSHFPYILARYNSREKTIEVCKYTVLFVNGNKLRKIIAHEQSHAIVDRKYRIWEDILNPFYKKYEDVYSSILKSVVEEMKEKLNRNYKKAVDGLEELIEKAQPESIEEYIIIKKVLRSILKDISFAKSVHMNMHCYGDLFDTINEISRKVVKRFRKEYGDKAGEIVRLIHEIRGLDEILAHAVEKKGLDIGVLNAGVCYLFAGTLTVYIFWKMLKEKGYPYVTDTFILPLVKRAKKLIKEI